MAISAQLRIKFFDRKSTYNVLIFVLIFASKSFYFRLKILFFRWNILIFGQGDLRALNSNENRDLVDLEKEKVPPCSTFANRKPSIDNFYMPHVKQISVQNKASRITPLLEPNAIPPATLCQ